MIFMLRLRASEEVGYENRSSGIGVVAAAVDLRLLPAGHEQPRRSIASRHRRPRRSTGGAPASLSRLSRARSIRAAWRRATHNADHNPRNRTGHPPRSGRWLPAHAGPIAASRIRRGSRRCHAPVGCLRPTHPTDGEPVAAIRAIGRGPHAPLDARRAVRGWGRGDAHAPLRRLRAPRGGGSRAPQHERGRVAPLTNTREGRNQPTTAAGRRGSNATVRRNSCRSAWRGHGGSSWQGFRRATRGCEAATDARG